MFEASVATVKQKRTQEVAGSEQRAKDAQQADGKGSASAIAMMFE